MTIRLGSVDKFTLYFSFFFVLNMLAAYSIGPVPLPWLAQLGYLGLFTWIFLRRKATAFPGFAWFVMLLMWAIVITLLNTAFGEFANLLPPKATTPYPVYVALRFLNLFGFFATVGITYWLFTHGQGPRLIRMIGWVGFVAAIFAIYVYLAQVKGWWEPPRTRVGTGGGKQITEFAYAFHRAMGSFREPSHLAEWLILPLFMSMTLSGRIAKVMPVVMGGVLLLTGSLTGILGALIGFSISVLLHFRRAIVEFQKSAKIVVPVVVAFLIFSVSVVQNYGGTTSIFTVLWQRIEPIVNAKGAEATNRDYVYEYVEDHPAPFFGYGLGHANLKFSRTARIDATASFLSLYLNMTYSMGYIGLILGVMILIYPYYLFFRRRLMSHGGKVFYLMAAYSAWIVDFAVHSEELNVNFGVIYAMTLFVLKYQERDPNAEEVT